MNWKVSPILQIWILPNPFISMLTSLHVHDSHDFISGTFLPTVRWGICHAVSQVTPACFPTLPKCVLTSRFPSKLCLDKTWIRAKGNRLQLCEFRKLGFWEPNHTKPFLLIIPVLFWWWFWQITRKNQNWNSRLSMVNCLSCLFGPVRPIAEIAYSA